MSIPFSLWSAAPTPLRTDGSLDEDGVFRMVEQHRALGVEGLFLAGSCGEGSYLDERTLTTLLRCARAAAGPAYPLSVQVASTDAARVAGISESMREAGADVQLVALPRHGHFPSREAWRRYVLDTLDAVSGPAGLYALPAQARDEEDAATWRALAAHPAVTVIKDSTRSEACLAEFRQARADRPGIRLYTGNEFDIMRYRQADCDGAMLGTGVLVGGMIRRLLEAWDRGDRAEAAVWQERSNRLIYDLFRPDLSAWLTGLKYALQQLGVFSTPFGYVGAALTAEDQERIRNALERERAWIGPGAETAVGEGSFA